MSLKSEQWIRHMQQEHGMSVFKAAQAKVMQAYAALWEGDRHQLSDLKSAGGALNWTSISNGSPEAGGGGASAAAVTDGGAPVAAASDDDDGGDPDPEPARRRQHTNGTAPVSGESLLRLRGVQARVPLSKSAIYKMIAESKFPEPIRLSARCSLWRASDIDAFVANLT